MCGGRDKPCATCALGGGGCLTAMYEDNYCPASISQVEKRLANGLFSIENGIGIATGEVMIGFAGKKARRREFLLMGAY